MSILSSSCLLVVPENCCLFARMMSAHKAVMFILFNLMHVMGTCKKAAMSILLRVCVYDASMQEAFDVQAFAVFVLWLRIDVVLCA